MILDRDKKPPVSHTGGQLQTAVASSSECKLSVELPSRRIIYTCGSNVAGIIRLGSKDRESVQEIQVSLVCIVRSHFHRYYGGTTHDVRRETTNLFHRDQTLWSRPPGDNSLPPDSLSFSLVIPEFGLDRDGTSVPLPPSFHAGRHHGWSNMFTYGNPIGFVKYHVKVKVTRKSMFKGKDRVFVPFIFLPPSPPPPLLPPLPETITEHDLDRRLGNLWIADRITSNLRQGIFSSSGQAELVLWLPRIENFPRGTQVPFILSLLLQTKRLSSMVSETEPPQKVTPPLPVLERAKLHLQRKIRVCARKAVQHHTKTFDKKPTDNLLHEHTPQEGPWMRKDSGGQVHWEKAYIWRGLWTFKETPNFGNRQLVWKYFLTAEIPIKGLTNDVKLTSRELQINTGIASGQNVAPGTAEEELELPPDYFDLEGTNEEDEGGGDDEKK